MLGEVEDERYVGVALYEGVPKGKRKGKQEFAMGQQMSNVIRSEPTVVACALNRPRFYLFTKREPIDTDDATVVRPHLHTHFDSPLSTCALCCVCTPMRYRW